MRKLRYVADADELQCLALMADRMAHNAAQLCAAPCHAAQDGVGWIFGWPDP
jgi:hypothetical protein